MKNTIIYGITILAISSINYASADCAADTPTNPNPNLTRAQIISALTDKVACVSGAPHNSQEEHYPLTGTGGSATGELWDYKEGDGHAIDPRKQVGIWKAGLNRVIYNYFGGSSSYAFTMKDNGSNNYSFCIGTTEEVNANIITSSTGCSGNYP